MCNGKSPCREKNSYAGFLGFLHTVPKDCIAHRKIAVENRYTSSARQLTGFNELGCMPSKLIANSYRRWW